MFAGLQVVLQDSKYCPLLVVLQDSKYCSLLVVFQALKYCPLLVVFHAGFKILSLASCLAGFKILSLASCLAGFKILSLARCLPSFKIMQSLSAQFCPVIFFLSTPSHIHSTVVLVSPVLAFNILSFHPSSSIILESWALQSCHCVLCIPTLDPVHLKYCILV